MGWQGASEPKHILAQVRTHTPYPLLTCPFPYLLHKTEHQILTKAMSRRFNSTQVQGVMLILKV